MVGNIIKVRANNDFRSFKKGYTVIFDYNSINTIFLMGINGCGKSTLIQAIRGTLNSNKDAKSKWRAKADCQTVKEMFDVTIKGFKNIYHLDVDGLDNAYSMYNACDASAYIENGGWDMMHFSSGEKSVLHLARLRQNVIDNENTLIIVDEIDNHLDFGMRIKFGKWLDKIFPKSKKLIITHDILMSTLNDGDIMEINAHRMKESNKFFCKTLGESPILWKNENKDSFFHLITQYKLSKIDSDKEG